MAEIGERVNILLNDMGTQEQRDAWTITGGMPEFIDSPTRDIDGDDLASFVRYRREDGSSSNMTIRIDAPEGMYFKNPVATADGYWSVNWANSTRLRLSLDGENFDFEAPTGSGDGWYNMIADATGEPGYEQPLSSLWVQVAMTTHNQHNTYDSGFRDLMVTAEIIPEPSTLALLGLAGLLMLKRRRM